MSDSDSAYRAFIRKANTTLVPLSVYDLLCRDYRYWSADIRGSEERWGALHPEPLSVDSKPTWLPDLREKLTDGMVYCRAELLKLEPQTRTCEKARHASLTIRDVERRLSRILADLSDLDTEWRTDGE